MEETPTDIKSELIDEIVRKVKSEGLFDQFRRECLADVDTKPAYQNLQHRVESSVSSYLGGQKWTPQLNKNQLREKLRKLITEKGFFEAGIERIVDQVVNPKLNSNLVPKIEDVAYKFLGVEKPSSFNIKLELGVAENVTSLPNLDLEQVSPESSEKSPSFESKSPALMANTMDAYYMHDESDDRMDDLESPAFEPIHASPNTAVDGNKNDDEAAMVIKREIIEKEDDDMDISDGDGDGPLQMNGSMMISNDEVKSNLSSISGLTSNDSNNDITNGINESDIKCEQDVETSTHYDQYDEQTDVIVTKEEIQIESCVAPEITFDSAEKLPQSENIISNTNELNVEDMNQDSVLSQVSSTSRLSIVTNNNTNTRMDDGEGDGDGDGDGYMNHMSRQPQYIVRETCPYGISEEAQMQKFNESSSSSNSLVIDTDNMSNGTNQCDKKEELITTFDIKREEFKFEGTERKSFDLSLNDSTQDKFNRCKSNHNSTNNIYSMGSNLISDHKVKTDHILKKQKTENKLDDIDSTNSENITMSIKSEFNSKSTSVDEEPSTPDPDDSKDKNSDSKSSLNLNGNDSDSGKHRCRDRSQHSSSRHRSHSEREKDRKSSSSSQSSSKDKTKCPKDGSDSKYESSKHRSSSNAFKHRHHKNELSRSSSSSSTKKEKELSRDRSDKSKSSKNSPPSDSGQAKKGHESAAINTSKKEHSRQSSSSSSNSKHRSSSRKDDHSIYKEKSSSRQRSRSKDSNDGSTHLQFGSQSVFSNAQNSSANQSTSNNKSSGTCSNETQAITSHSIDQPLEAVTEDFSPRTTTATNELPDSNDRQITSTQENAEFVLTTKPVVVDQILAGNELNLELFIGENRDDPVVSSIGQTLEPDVKKPKVAANIFEARKLSKVRKEIERNKRKKLEQATVLAKQYIRTNPSTVRDDSQGVELEFVCIKPNRSGTVSAGPIISSPAKYKNGIIESKTVTPNATITSSNLSMDSKSAEPTSIETFAMETEEIGQSSDDRIINENNNDTDMTGMQNDEICLGFNERALELARDSYCIFSESLKSIIEKAPLRNRSKIITKKMNNTTFAPSTEEERHQLIEKLNNQLLFLENNKLSESTSKSILNRKRLTNDLPNVSSNKIPTSTNDNEMILASVFISQTSAEYNVKPDSSTQSDTEQVSALEKQRQKTRYSNDDLFKPRPVLGGISRSRRRGYNCNE